uniref:Uncharacterized protein n=1 Tax=Romanomermis culicivorax TaxID=13658 RepID=A0A915HWX2_ROMCU
MSTLRFKPFWDPAAVAVVVLEAPARNTATKSLVYRLRFECAASSNPKPNSMVNSSAPPPSTETARRFFNKTTSYHDNFHMRSSKHRSRGSKILANALYFQHNLFY